MDTSRFIPGDKTLIQNIVEYLKAKGIFDEYRHECLADVDTKSSCQNLSQRIDGYTAKFLGNETWHSDLNKNELRNKLRRHIDESGMLAVGADHVVEQVINPKITQLFLPSIIKVVHQYIREETEKLNAKQEFVVTEEPDKSVAESSEGKTKAVSDPIADILAFSYSKSKQTTQSSSNAKTESGVSKIPDLSSKTEKKKEEKTLLPVKAEQPADVSSENLVSTSVEIKLQNDNKELTKVKKEPKPEEEIPAETQKKIQKGDSKPEKRKLEDIKLESSEQVLPCEENVSNKLSNAPVPVKAQSSSSVKSKLDVDKSKLKVKSQNLPKVSSDVRKVKSKENLDSSKPSSEKHTKPVTKISKTPTKEISSPFKSGSSKSSKDDKFGESSVKSKSSDNSTKSSDSAMKKSSSSKLSCNKKDDSTMKPKVNTGKDDKIKHVKSSVLPFQKGEQSTIADNSSNSEKGSKSHSQFSSSHESSQGSDQDKSSTKSVNPKVRQKLFSKHIKKDSVDKTESDDHKKLSKKQLVKHSKETFKSKQDKKSKLSICAEKQKEFVSHDVAKISSRSNSFGSSSSVSSSSNASKDNSSCTLDSSDNTVKTSEKKKKQTSNDKDQCHGPQTFPPPPPPPPSSGACEAQSSAEISSMDDTQSSQGTEDSSSETSDKSISESETDEHALCVENSNDTLKSNTPLQSNRDNLDELYDIFLYSSSSSEFEGYFSSPEKTDFCNENFQGSEISISSVHTSDLSSFDDELSDDEDSCNEDEQKPRKVKKRFTIREAQEFLRKKADEQLSCEDKNSALEDKAKESMNNTYQQYSSYPSSDEESNSHCEPKRELRRERRVNPKYASSEYTSIFNSKKESFITKHCSKAGHNDFTPEVESDEKNKELPVLTSKDKAMAKRKIQLINSPEIENVKYQKYDPDFENTKYSVKESTSKLREEAEFQGYDNQNSLGFSENKCRLALQVKKSENKCHSQNHLELSSHPVKRKISNSSESSSVKRPCSRSSVDSCSSEFVANENKPFNNEKEEISVSTGMEQKIHKAHGNLKNSSDLTKNFKKGVFCQQNNGDILGKVEHIKKNSQSKAHSTSEKNKNESDINSEPTAV